MKTNIMKIEKLDPENPPAGPWVSIWNGPFIVVGTDDFLTAKEFVREFLAAGPSLGDPATIGRTTIPDWTK